MCVWFIGVTTPVFVARSCQIGCGDNSISDDEVVKGFMIQSLLQLLLLLLQARCGTDRRQMSECIDIHLGLFECQ
jgi:hypothetical protein